jgi:hypothetical protein
VRVFACPECHAWVEFEDLVCLSCGTALAYDPDGDTLVRRSDVVLCAHWAEIGCNWASSARPPVAPDAGAGGDAPEPCLSCRLTVERPADGDVTGHSQLVLAEFAKRRLVRQLRHLHLPIAERVGEEGLGFRLLSPAPGEHIITGHDNGLITIDLSESNDPHREALRIRLGEPYRTMLGHLRHEIGHYYWLVLVDGSAQLEGFRELFGDEREDYGAALQAHYGNGPADGWADHHISHYATTHPWEDFAETFAHYLHIADVLETTYSVGVTVEGPHGVPEPLARRIAATGAAEIAGLPMTDVLGRWHGFSLALNAVNRSMGRQDLYPFVITPGVAQKLAWVHELVGGLVEVGAR